MLRHFVSSRTRLSGRAISSAPESARQATRPSGSVSRRHSHSRPKTHPRAQPLQSGHLYRWTESVTCTGSSLFAVGYAYSERHRKYSALLPFRLRQTDLNPRQECHLEEPARHQHVTPHLLLPQAIKPTPRRNLVRDRVLEVNNSGHVRHGCPRVCPGQAAAGFERVAIL